LLFFLSNFYKIYAPKEWDKVRLKIPAQSGLFGTIFTSIARKLDAASWHLDSGDLEFAVILYVGKWEREALLFGLQETPIKLVVGNMDFVFIKSEKISLLPFKTFWSTRTIVPCRRHRSFWRF
jgi:hypothetical protein